MDTDLSLEEIHLFSALEQRKSLASLGKFLGRDKSVVSRRLTEIARKSPVLEKFGTQWRLNELGRRLTKLALDFDAARRQVLEQAAPLTIIGSQLFVSAFLSRKLGEIQELFPKREICLGVHRGNPERYLQDGACDLAFSCGRPQDPSVAFRRTTREPYYAFCTPEFARIHGAADFRSLQRSPHIALLTAEGNLPFLSQLIEETPIAFRVHDLLSAMGGVGAGLGWSILPYYALEIEAKRGNIRLFELADARADMYGVWWLRSRSSVAPLAQSLCQWLAKQKLEPI